MTHTNNAILSRADTCEHCGREGIHVDTSAGEIIIRGEIVAVAPEGALPLSPDEGGRMMCDECADLLAPTGV